MLNSKLLSIVILLACVQVNKALSMEQKKIDDKNQNATIIRLKRKRPSKFNRQDFLKNKIKRASNTLYTKPIFEKITSFKNYDEFKNGLFFLEKGEKISNHKNLVQIISSIFDEMEEVISKTILNKDNWFFKEKNNKNFNIYSTIKSKKFRYIKKNFIRDEKIIIIGDLHGNFSDFDSIIVDLIDRKILTKNLKLIDNYKIVVLGDFIDRGLNSLAITLTLMALQIINNEKIIILQGNHENDSSYHKDTDFHNELSKKISFNSENYKSKFSQYFKMLPAAYFIRNKETNKTLMFNHGGWENIPLKINTFFDSNKKMLRIPEKLARRLIWNDIDFENEIKEPIEGARGDNSLLLYPNDIVLNSMKNLEIIAKFGGHMHNVPKGKLINDRFNKMTPGFIHHKGIYVLISGDIQTFDDNDKKLTGSNYNASYLELELSSDEWTVYGYTKEKFQKIKVPTY